MLQHKLPRFAARHAASAAPARLTCARACSGCCLFSLVRLIGRRGWTAPLPTFLRWINIHRDWIAGRERLLQSLVKQLVETFLSQGVRKFYAFYFSAHITNPV